MYTAPSPSYAQDSVSKLKSYVTLLRPKHWVKNLFILMPFFFGQQLGQLKEPRIYLIVLSMCLLASAVYIINDANDVEKDRIHPKKQLRPLASGAIKLPWALTLAGLLITGSLSIGFLFDFRIGALLTMYLLMNIAYTLKLKEFAVIDVTIIAIGFIIRIFIGGFAGDITISKWFILMVYLLSLTLALGKRRDDLLLQEQNEWGVTSLRNSLNGYSLEFINFSISMLSIISVVCYIMYTVSPEVAQRLHSELLYLTSFPVIMGFIRYFQKAYVHKDTGSPTKLLLTDKQMQFWVVTWIATYSFLSYVKF